MINPYHFFVHSDGTKKFGLLEKGYPPDSFYEDDLEDKHVLVFDLDINLITPDMDSFYVYGVIKVYMGTQTTDSAKMYQTEQDAEDAFYIEYPNASTENPIYFSEITSFDEDEDEDEDEEKQNYVIIRKINIDKD